MLTLDELRADPTIDTVIMAFTDMQGRLLGKRLHRDFFFEQVDHGHGTEGCNYLLALDMEMDPVPGYEIASWERGYGDFELVPDLATLRRIPWLEATALVLCDVAWGDGSPVRPSPRQVLRAQLERAQALGLRRDGRLGARVLSCCRETYEQAHTQALPRPDAVGAVHPRLPHPRDRPIDEPLLRQIRNGMQGAGMRVETSKGEAWPGQQEINFRYDDALTMADNHVVYKNGAKEIAHLNGCSITFMAKPDHTWIGIVVPHPLVAVARRRERVRRRERRVPAVPRGADRVRARAGGVLRAEHQLVQAVRGRLVGADDARVGARQPHVRLPRRRLGRGDARRVADPRRRRESVSRVRGDDRGGAATASRTSSSCRPRSRGTRTSRRPTGSRRRCATRSPRSRAASMARAALGDDVVEHYLNYARTEQALFDRVVTNWERERFYERG